ncbi:MAG: methylated-DNA--[protein]-cysteine S-methyltransferase [Candidatus Limnocylindria bacterium]
MPVRISLGSVETGWGPMLLAASPAGMLEVARGTDAAALVARLLLRLPDAAVVDDEPAHGGWLVGWVAGRERGLAPVDLRGLPAFDADVYRAVRDIGWGERATYGDVAVAIGRPGAARAVGGAMGRCPLFPAVPCHRVVRAADGWSGWGSGGDEVKRRLLLRERPR